MSFRGEVTIVDGLRLFYEVEPSGSCEFDTLDCETFDEAIVAIEEQIYAADPNTRFTITTRWVTEAQWEARKETWVNG